MEKCLKKGDPELLVFTSDQVLQRVEKSGDLFEPVLKLKQKLPPLTALGQGTPNKYFTVGAESEENSICTPRS